MTVAQLIRALEALPGDHRVVVEDEHPEGFMAEYDVEGVEVLGGRVMIR